MKMGWLVVLCGLCVACGPAHLRSVGTGGSRDLGDVFLGGWDGRRLRVFNDTEVEPGKSPRGVLVTALSDLSPRRYTPVWVESARLDGAARAEGVFCEAPWCLIVFERDQRRGGYLEWGEVAAVFELSGPMGETVSSVWLSESSIRVPGPRRWPLRCVSAEAAPRWVHPDGGAFFPERRSPGGTPFALFDRRRVEDAYRQAGERVGFAAPSEETCDYELAQELKRPPPPRPIIEADPGLLGTEALEEGIGATPQEAP